MAAARPRRVSNVGDEDEAFRARKTDQAAQRRTAGTRDRQRAQHYSKGETEGAAAGKRAPGRRARPDQVSGDEELQGLYEQGYRQGHRQSRRQAGRQTVSRATAPAVKRATSWSHEGAGFLLGLVAFALGRSYLLGGPAGVKAWLKAKFLNEASPGPGGTTTPATPTAPSAGGSTVSGPVGPSVARTVNYSLPPSPGSTVPPVPALGR